MALSLPPELWEMIGLCLIDQDPLSSPAGMAHDIAALGCTSKDPNLQAGVAVAWRALEGCCRVRSTPRVCPPAFGSWRVVWAHVNTYSLDQLRACLRALGSSFIGNRAATLQQLLPILPTDWPGASPDLRDLVKSSRNNCITQTEALKQYRLQKEDLEGVRVRIRGNTHLYRVTDVMRLAQFKYGSAAGLQARNEQILEASAKRRRTAEYNQSMQGPRTQQIIKALAKAHVDYVLEDLLIPAAQKYIKSGTGSLAKVVAAVKALIATEVRTQEVQDLVQERDLPSAGWHRNLPEYQAYVDNGDGSLEDVIEAISEEAERRSLVEARRQQLTAAVGAEMDLLEMPICKDYVERNRGDLQAVLAMISDVAADRKWRRQEVDQLLATYDLADFSQLKTWSGNTVSQPCGFFQAYINGQADAAPLEQLAEQAFLYRKHLDEAEEQRRRQQEEQLRRQQALAHSRSCHGPGCNNTPSPTCAHHCCNPCCRAIGDRGGSYCHWHGHGHAPAGNAAAAPTVAAAAEGGQQEQQQQMPAASSMANILASCLTQQPNQVVKLGSAPTRLQNTHPGAAPETTNLQQGSRAAPAGSRGTVTVPAAVAALPAEGGAAIKGQDRYQLHGSLGANNAADHQPPRSAGPVSSPSAAAQTSRGMTQAAAAQRGAPAGADGRPYASSAAATWPGLPGAQPHSPLPIQFGRDILPASDMETEDDEALAWQAVAARRLRGSPSHGHGQAGPNKHQLPGSQTGTGPAATWVHRAGRVASEQRAAAYQPGPVLVLFDRDELPDSESDADDGVSPPAGTAQTGPRPSSSQQQPHFDWDELPKLHLNLDEVPDSDAEHGGAESRPRPSIKPHPAARRTSQMLSQPKFDQDMPDMDMETDGGFDYAELPDSSEIETALRNTKKQCSAEAASPVVDGPTTNSINQAKGSLIMPSAVACLPAADQEVAKALDRGSNVGNAVCRGRKQEQSSDGHLHRPAQHARRLLGPSTADMQRDSILTSEKLCAAWRPATPVLPPFGGQPWEELVGSSSAKLPHEGGHEMQVPGKQLPLPGHSLQHKPASSSTSMQLDGSVAPKKQSSPFTPPPAYSGQLQKDLGSSSSAKSVHEGGQRLQVSGKQRPPAPHHWQCDQIAATPGVQLKMHSHSAFQEYRSAPNMPAEGPADGGQSKKGWDTATSSSGKAGCSMWDGQHKKVKAVQPLESFQPPPAPRNAQWEQALNTYATPANLPRSAAPKENHSTQTIPPSTPGLPADSGQLPKQLDKGGSASATAAHKRGQHKQIPDGQPLQSLKRKLPHDMMPMNAPKSSCGALDMPAAAPAVASDAVKPMEGLNHGSSSANAARQAGPYKQTNDAKLRLTELLEKRRKLEQALETNVMLQDGNIKVMEARSLLIRPPAGPALPAASSNHSPGLDKGGAAPNANHKGNPHQQSLPASGVYPAKSATAAAPTARMAASPAIRGTATRAVGAGGPSQVTPPFRDSVTSTAAQAMQHSSPSLSPSQPTAYLESSVTTRGAHTLGQAGVPQDPADHKLDAAEPRQSVLGWAMSKLGHTLW